MLTLCTQLYKDTNTENTAVKDIHKNRWIERVPHSKWCCNSVKKTQGPSKKSRHMYRKARAQTFYANSNLSESVKLLEFSLIYRIFNGRFQEHSLNHQNTHNSTQWTQTHTHIHTPTWNVCHTWTAMSVAVGEMAGEYGAQSSQTSFCFPDKIKCNLFIYRWSHQSEANKAGLLLNTRRNGVIKGALCRHMVQKNKNACLSPCRTVYVYHVFTFTDTCSRPPLIHTAQPESVLFKVGLTFRVRERRRWRNKREEVRSVERLSLGKKETRRCMGARSGM